MLTYLDLIQPGFSCRRGMILYELHTALLVQGRAGLSRDKAGARLQLRRSLQCLRQCLAVLGLHLPRPAAHRGERHQGPGGGLHQVQPQAVIGSEKTLK